MLEKVLFHTISIALNRITQNFDQNDLKLEILSMEDFENKYHYRVRLNNDSYKIVFEKDNAVTLSGFVTILKQCSTDKEYKFYIEKINDVISVYSNLSDYDVHIQLDVSKILQIRIKENKKISISTMTFTRYSSTIFKIGHIANVPIPIFCYDNDLLQNLFVLSDAKDYKSVKCWDIVYFDNKTSGVLICTIGNKHIFALIDKLENARRITLFNSDFRRLIQYNKTSDTTYYTCDYEQSPLSLRLTKSYTTDISQQKMITVISSKKKYTYEIDGSNVTFKQI